MDRRIFKNSFIAFNRSKRIQQQFSTNRIKIGLLEPDIQPAKAVARRHYAGPMKSRDVIGLLSVTISLVTLSVVLCLRKYICKTHKKFQVLSYHSDVVRGGCLSYIAPSVTFRRLCITPSPENYNFFTFERYHS